MITATYFLKNYKRKKFSIAELKELKKSLIFYFTKEFPQIEKYPILFSLHSLYMEALEKVNKVIMNAERN